MISADFGLLLALVGGLLAFFSPCVLPILPAYVGYLSGVGAQQLTDQRYDNKPWWRSHLFLSSLLFALGFAVVFVLLGLGISAVGQFVVKNRLLLQQVGGVFLIIIGLYVLEMFRWVWLAKERRLNWHHQFGRLYYFNSFLVGVTFGLGWTPCIGPLLATILVLASFQATLYQGTLLLVAFSIGLAGPFLLLGVLADRLLPKLRQLNHLLPVIQKIAGAIILLVGLLLLVGWWNGVLAWFIKTFPLPTGWQL